MDSHKVMDIFYEDTKLNISAKYLKPGFAFGGSCLPKDLRALNHKAAEAGVSTPLLQALTVSNNEQIKRGLDMIIATGKKSVGVLGISFKVGTDDLRESPVVEVIRQLLVKGVNILVYDGNVSITKLPDKHHIKSMLSGNMDKVLKKSDVIVIGNSNPEFATIAEKLRPEQIVIDFVRIREIEETHANYHGICW